MTIEIDWWVVPVALTIIAFLVAALVSPKEERGNYLPDFVSVMMTGFYHLAAIIFSLVCWLLWALVT